MENRPRIKIEKDTQDWIIALFGFFFLIAIIGYSVYHYAELPNKIPSHYGLNGKPDAFSNKSTLLVLLGITILMYAGMYILNKFPHIFNYPEDMTEEQAPAQYKKASKLMRLINTVMVISFSYLIFSTVQTAYQNQNGLGWYFMPLFLAAVFVPIIFYIVQSYRDKKANL